MGRATRWVNDGSRFRYAFNGRIGVLRSDPVDAGHIRFPLNRDTRFEKCNGFLQRGENSDTCQNLQVAETSESSSRGA
jgi:hypothetical protein